MFTRQDYLNRICTHQQYFAQFVTDSIKNHVAETITIKRLLLSHDPYLNDIPLKKWDVMTGVFMYNKELKEQLQERGDFLTLANGVCILKEAARQVINECQELTQQEKGDWYTQLEEIQGILTRDNVYCCAMCFALHHADNFNRFSRYVAQGKKILEYGNVFAIVITGDDHYDYMEEYRNGNVYGVYNSIICAHCHDDIACIEEEEEVKE